MKEDCPHCGSTYEVTETKLTHRDKDSINCQVCGKMLKEWNGAVSYTAKLIEKGNPKV